MLDTAHGQIHVLTCGPSDGEANHGTPQRVENHCHFGVPQFSGGGQVTGGPLINDQLEALSL